MKVGALVGMVLAALAAASGARGAGGVCQALAKPLRSDRGDRGMAASVLTTLAERSHGGLRLDPGEADGMGALAKLRPTRDLSDAAHRLQNPRLFRLDAKGAGVLMDSEGTLHCANLVFFRSHDGAARPMPPPRQLRIRGTHLCWLNTVRFGRVGDQPVLIEEDAGGAPWNVELMVTPWADDGWAPTCHIKARFRPAYTLTDAFCAPGVDCRQLGEVAFGLALRRENKLPLPAAPADLQALAAKTEAFDETPSFGKTLAYSRVRDAELATFPGADGDRLAQVGVGTIGWREYPGVNVAIWRRAGERLEPVAGFQITRGRGRPISVKVTP